MGTWERPVQAVLPTSLLGGVLPVDSASCHHGFGLRLDHWSRVEPVAAGVRETTVLV